MIYKINEITTKINSINQIINQNAINYVQINQNENSLPPLLNDIHLGFILGLIIKDFIPPWVNISII